MRFIVLFFLYLCFIFSTFGSTLPITIEKIKASVVGIGIYTPTGRPKNSLKGTGFVVANGRYVVTNYHVVPDNLDEGLLQKFVVFTGSGNNAKIRKAELLDYSVKYDLALLKIEGSALIPMSLADDKYVLEGSEVAFTGFPIGAVLGLYPVTHRGIIASITPTVTPVADSRQINIAMLKRMKDPYLVYQLDATAYPGNSGSAVYEANTGKVVGVINKVFVQKTKEGAISNPSGITYAIPVKYVIELLEKNQIKF